VQEVLQKGGVPLYQDIPRAAVALSKLAGHAAFKRKLSETEKKTAHEKI
jgi:acyl-CoA synthetase (NDP forming)